MKQIFLFVISIFFVSFLHAQQTNNPLLELRKGLKANGVYTPAKNYKYQVTKFATNGDTISTELVKMRIPTELNTETFEDGKVYFIWEYTQHDDYKAKLSPLTKAFNERDWMVADTTTMRFNEEDLYLHPMRENQYYQAEVAAHPTVEFTDLIDGKYKSKIIILKGFGKYNMQEFTSYYEPKGKQDFNLGEAKLDCYKIIANTKVKAFSFGSSKGEKNEVFGEKDIINTTTFLIHENYGFVKIQYLFYDGEELIMEMVE